MPDYVHKKTGNIYKVLGCGVDCTNNRDGNPIVVYYAKDDPTFIFVRDKEEFDEKFSPVGEAYDKEHIQTDRDRLDWLEKNKVGVNFIPTQHRVMTTMTPPTYEEKTTESGWTTDGYAVDCTFDTIRQAIDEKIKKGLAVAKPKRVVAID